MKNKVLNELFLKRINKIITEEFGINDALDRAASKASLSIISNLQGKDFIWDDNSNVYKKKHIETVTIENNTVKIHVTNYWFKTEKDYLRFLNETVIPFGYVYEVNMIFIPLYSIGKREFNQEEAADSIYHEIEHFFQTLKMEHNFGSEQLYVTARQYLQSQDKTERALADIIYISSPSEQDAMVNGMYGSLKGCSMIEIHKKIRESDAAMWCKRLYEDYQLLKNTNEDAMLPALKQYGKTKKWFIRIAAKAIRRYEEKIARTSFKLIKDAQRRDGFHDEPKINENYSPGKNYCLTTIFDGILE